VPLKILSRASDLARLQAMSVERALRARWPDLDVTLVHRATLGDRDQQSALSQMTDKGAFTADLSDALVSGDADLVVHSWKDLPLVCRPETMIGATLERADPRDLLLVRRDVVAGRKPVLSVLSSSPRRIWLLEQSLSGLLPWPVEKVECVPVRGNIPTRLSKLASGAGDALVVAKAALDRLLGFGPPFEEVATEIRRALAATHWMVLPVREQPGAPAQGALAVEVAQARADVRDRVEAISHAPTWQAVDREREILSAYGGGCHQAVGATVLVRDYGTVTSVRARPDRGGVDERWSLTSDQVRPPKASAALVWPRADERTDPDETPRRPIAVEQPRGDAGFWVARANALPEAWSVSRDRFVWAAGTRTWRKLAARGVWVNGCTDGLGDDEAPRIDLLAGREVRWTRLTHAGARQGGLKPAPPSAAPPSILDTDALVTYVVEERLPDDLPARTHFFWTSGSLFLRAIQKWPELAARWHASGPGRTRRVIREALGPGSHASVWLDRDEWYESVTR
jgi:hydroxymethylbilane synthase